MLREAVVACVALCFTGCSGSSPQPGPFTDITGDTGLAFHHFTGATGQYYLPEIMGSGVAVFDYDGDGDLDLFFPQGRLLDAREPLFPLPAGSPAGSRLYRNQLIPGGTLRFEDVTDHSGIAFDGYAMGAATGDVDGDGDPDLYITGFGLNALYRNDRGRFVDITKASGAQTSEWSTSAAFADYDRDGDLDLYVCNYLDFTVKTNKACRAASGQPDYCSPRAYNPVADRLLRNDGSGRFTDVSAASGIGSRRGPGLGILWTDANNDGWPDAYVANDGDANFLWVNQRNGTFQEAGVESGTAFNEDGIPQAGMGVAAGDYDMDGDDDLVVTNLNREGTTLYRNDGDLLYIDLSTLSGVRHASFALTGFGVAWLDFDHDGDLDLFTTNGAVTVVENQRGQPYPFAQPDLLLRNTGKHLEAVAGAFTRPGVGRGAATGDLDLDGDPDLVVSYNNGSGRIYRNNARGEWLVVETADPLGATVRLCRPNRPRLRAQISTSGSYLSAREPAAHFGLGGAAPEAIEVIWADGHSERHPWSKANCRVRISREAPPRRVR